MSASAGETRPLRVVDIINLSSSADTLLRERVLDMRANGIDNRIVCIAGPRVAPLRALGIPVHCVRMPRGVNPWMLAVSIFETALHLRRVRPDVVHTHCAIPGFVGRIAAWLARVPVIIHTAHGFHFHAGMSWFVRLPYVLGERLCGLVTDTLLTQNRSDLEQAERFGIGPRGRRRYIGNGIDLEQFRPRAERAPRGEVAVLTCVARLEPVKNHRMLFEAVAKLRQRGTPCRLRLVGDGPLRHEYEELCRQLGIGECVEFLGYRNDVPELLAGTDIAVLTSIKEGMQRAVIEPMAMGIPVVATRAPGTREVLRHGETGLAVEVGDTEGLAAALSLLIGDPALRARLGERGREVAALEFDERPIVAALRELYGSRLLTRGTPVRSGTLVEEKRDRVSPPAPVPGAEPAVERASGLRVGRNALFLFAGQGVCSAINVVAMALLGSALAPRGYGEYAFYYALIPLVAGISDAGIGMVVTREVARDHSQGPRLLGDALLLRAAISGLILLPVLVVAWTMLAPPSAALISLVAATALIDPGQDPSIWMCRAREQLHLEALLMVLSQVVWLPLLVVGVVMQARLSEFLAAATVAFAMRTVVGAVIVVRRFGRPEFRPERARLAHMLREGLPYGVAMFATVLYARVGLLALNALATSSDVAYLNVAYMLSQPLSFIASVIGIAILPTVARDARAGEQVLHRDILHNFKWQVLAALPLAVGLVLLARPIVALLFRGPGFAPAAVGLQVMSLGLVVMFLNISSRYLLAALDRQGRYLRAILLGLVVNVVLCVVLIPRGGFLGACVAFLGAELAIWITCQHALGSRVGLADMAGTAAKPLLAALGMGLLVYTLRGMNVWILVALGAVFYLGFLLLLRAFSDGELETFRKIGASFGVRNVASLQRAGDRP